MISRDSPKVVHISEDSRGGGQFQYILDIATDSKGDYTVICPELDESLTNSVGSLNFKLITINLQVLNTKRIFAFLVSFITEIRTIAKILEQNNPDIVVCHGATQVKGVVAAYLAKIPSIWVMHDSYLSGISKIIFGVFHRLCSNYIFVSERSRKFYNNTFSGLNSSLQVVIPSSIDHDKYKPGTSAVLPEIGFHVITTCYINKWKGLELLIDIAHYIQQGGHHDIVFHIIGPILKSRQRYADTLMDKISSLQVENITFHGYRSNIPEYLKSASIYLCTSTHESSPISIWEAMATGLPIVSSDVGDLISIVGNTNGGIVLTDRLAKSYVDAILELRANDDLRKKFGQNAYQATLVHFSKTSFQDNHRRFYLKVADR